MGNKKVSFSKKKQYKGEKDSAVEVVDDVPDDNSSQSNPDDWAEEGDVDLSKPHRNVTDTPKPTIFTPAAQFWLIPVHLLAILYAMFEKFDLLTDVEGGLLQALYVLLPAQFVYGILLTIDTNRTRIAEKKSKKKSTTCFDSGDIINLTFALVLSLAASIPFFVALLLFGAPIGSYTERTYQLAIHLALTTTYPLLCTYRLSDTDFKSCWSNLLTFQVDKFYKNQVYAMAVGGVVGCWLGVIPIPLDWDRPWQVWPVTLLAGTYLGTFVGNFVAFVASKL